MGDLLDQEIEKEINSEILETAQLLFKKFEQDLNAPETRKLYVNGLYDTAIRSGTDPLLEAVALKIIEIKTLQECTLDEELQEFLNEDLFFYTDLFYTLVTTVIELAAVRRDDIPLSGPIPSLFSVMTILMESLKEIPELDNLRNVLRDLSDNYLQKPELQKRIAQLVPADPEKNGIYFVYEPKRMSDYANSDILAILDPSENIAESEVAGVPPGVSLSVSKGEIKVENVSQLVRGVYPIHIKTQDAEGGITLNTIDLPIGRDSKAVYTVKPYLKVTQYGTDDILATVSDPDGPIVSAKLIELSGAALQQALPGGVALNAVNGVLSVSEKRLLVPGIYPLSIETTDTYGFKTDHRIILVFKEDQPASYQVFAPNAISEYQNKQVLAKVTDADAPVIDAVVTGLPAGVMLDPVTGNIVVENATLLQSGTHRFSIKSTTSAGVEKVTAAELTLGTGSSQVLYTLLPSKKVQNYINEDVLASLNTFGLSVESVNLLSGILPPGVTLNKTSGAISVTNVAVLKPGSYGLTIQVKLLGSAPTSHSLDLVIEEDYKAVYRVTYAKDILDYADEEVIAEVIDCDGIIAAVVTEGALPPGTELNAATGAIKVVQAASLVAGKYVLKIQTTDAENGTTVSRIAIFFQGIDNEAIYTVLPARSADSYKEGDLLATVEDADIGVVKASISQGALPSGTSLNTENGNVFVSNTKAITAGTFGNIFIKTVDGVGGITESEITLTFLDDLVITYLVYNAKVVTAYSNGNLLSKLVSANPGDIKSAVLTNGKLPSGTRLNSINGEITVSNATLLVPGNYFIYLSVTDKNGGETSLSFEIVLLEDHPATWQVIPPTSKDSLTNGLIVAQPTDPNGTIVSATILSGTVPAGMTFSALSGVITVSNAAIVVAGNYALQIQTTDVVGGVTIADILIIIQNIDSEAIYTVADAQNIDTYETDALLAFVNDANGPVVNAVIISGSIPPGTQLLNNGDVRVADLTTLMPGLFSATIRTTDNVGFTTDSIVVIEILDDTEAVYTISPPINFDAIEDGTLLAAVSDPDAAIISAVLTGGSLIPGTQLYEDETMTNGTPRNVGDIAVVNAGQVVPGTYTNIHILTVDESGGQTTFNLTLTISPDNEAVYTIQFSRDIHSYRNGDVIAFPVDVDGAVTQASLISGSLHSGVSFNTMTGQITIAERTAISGGFRNVEVMTTDASGGITTQNIGIEIKLRPNRQVRALYNSFIVRFPQRLEELEVLFADRLTPEFTSNINFIGNAKDIANAISTELQDPGIEPSYWGGEKDDQLSSNFLNISAPVRDGIIQSYEIIQGGGEPSVIAAAQRDLLLRTAIYAEIFESMLDAVCYRLEDITDADTHPINNLIDQLDVQLELVKDIEEVGFMIENINLIKLGTLPTHPWLIKALNELIV